ncbi:hypothetical protein [Serratia marcescens]|uniref:hypothetical protein n=1 Tax=Serratia marcescens TaxID=615 RepID=UPI0007454861|nr:hypothetical protein [Serratia marcescens]CUY07987.1 Uncharacterised protein [Serratia marcescens]CUY22196.1 Uncharacterised protein [Serratia marcescens]CUY56207.1 Uncharacterised protein [Serratia marcescens]CUZ39754.1 Uncharacterised protein [Serratia marcescens]CVA83291.1 Uncharacterised protein [Serratia marcescens]
MNNQQESKNIKLNNSDFTFLADQKSWLKIPADGSPLTFTGNADDAAKEFFNALIRVRDGYISALKAERDALAQRVEMLAQNLGNAIWGEQEALQRVNTLAVENAVLKSKASELVHEASEVYSAYNATIREPDGDFMDMQTLYEMQRIETPATSAALAAIQAQGVEKLIKLKMEQLANMHPDTHAFGATAESLRAQINELQAFAAELREDK